jgi:ATP-dependent DNA helicase RecQ
VISNVLEGRDQIVILPTGAGKSLCHQLPSLLLPGLTVVVVPLLALLADQLARSREAGLAAEALRGGQDEEERRRIAADIASGRLRLLFSTPEAMWARRGRELMRGVHIDHLAVDEAHCVAEWGASFRPAYLHLRELIGDLSVRCCTAFTATAGPELLKVVKEVIFSGRAPSMVAGDPDRPNIHYRVLPVLSRARELQRLVRVSPRPVLVFSRSRGGAERAARLLRRLLPSLPAYFYHAGLYPSERSRVEAWFKGSRDGVLAATSAYGMGVDKPDVRTVIHLELPYSPEAYLQETGRAGRDGGPVEASLLCGPEDLQFGELLQEEVERRRYQQMLSYATEAGRCRRRTLLSFLGPVHSVCSGCDVCDGKVRAEAEGEGEIMAFVRRHRRRFTAYQTARILAARKSHEAALQGFASVRGHGALASWELEDIEEALEALLRSRALRAARRGPWKGLLAPAVLPKPPGLAIMR